MTFVSENEQGTLDVTFANGHKINLRKPDRAILSQALAMSQKDTFGAVDVLVKRCLTKGDPNAILDNSGYCHQMLKVMDDLFGRVECSITFEDEPDNLVGSYARLEFADGEKVLLSIPTRKQYAAARNAAKINPLRFAEDLVKSCWVDGNKDLQTSAGHLLGFSGVSDELLSYTGDRLGNS